MGDAHICRICGTALTGRPHAKTCGPTCRQKLHRKLADATKKAKPGVKELPKSGSKVEKRGQKPQRERFWTDAMAKRLYG